jgi:hypothetical protein
MELLVPTTEETGSFPQQRYLHDPTSERLVGLFKSLLELVLRFSREQFCDGDLQI